MVMSVKLEYDHQRLHVSLKTLWIIDLIQWASYTYYLMRKHIFLKFELNPSVFIYFEMLVTCNLSSAIFLILKITVYSSSYHLNPELGILCYSYIHWYNTWNKIARVLKKIFNIHVSKTDFHWYYLDGVITTWK